MGRLIPAGTGLARYKRVGIHVNAPELSEVGFEEEVISTPPGPTLESVSGGEELIVGGVPSADSFDT
jgi:hypothetical protein